jgi:hypothetical protein
MLAEYLATEQAVAAADLPDAICRVMLASLRVAGVAFFGNSNGGLSAGVRMNEFKYFTNFESGSKRFFNIKDDRREQVNLVNDQSKAALVEKYYKMVTDVYVQHTRLIKENRIWNWKYGMKVKRPVASSPSNN